MANKKNINLESVNTVLISNQPTKDISLSLPVGDLKVVYLGDLDDSAEKAEWDKLSEREKKEHPHAFWWCSQPFIGFGIAARPSNGTDEDWHEYAVVGPAFVKGAPELASAEFRSAQCALKIEKRKEFNVKHEIKLLLDIDPRTGSQKKKHVFSV